MKYITLLMIICIMMVPAIAQDDNNGNGNGNTQPAGPSAETIKSTTEGYINSFFNKAGSMLPDADTKKAEMLTLADQMANAGISQETLDKVGQYFNGTNGQPGVLARVDSMKATANGYSNNAQPMADFFQQAASLNNYFLQDMKTDANAFTFTQYMQDFDTLKTGTENYLKSINTTTQQGSNTARFNPLSYLDKNMDIPTKRAVKLDIDGFGLFTNRFAGTIIKDMVTRMRNTFSYDSTLYEDLSFILSMWPQSTEQLISDSNYPADGNIYQTLSQQGTRGYVVNEYGQIIPSSASTAAYTRTGKNDIQDNNGLEGSIIDQRFNARTYGGSNGIYPQVTLTVGGRSFRINDEIFTSPIVLDMDGDNKIDASNGAWKPHRYSESNGKMVEFDLNGDGFTEFVEWVGPNDGLLLEYNPNEEVNGNHLFGEAGGYCHGYANMQALDENNDNILDGNELKTLSVWQDANGDAKVQKGEVKSVQELGITSLNANHTDYVSSFVQNGSKKSMWDWYPTVFRVTRRK